MYVVVRLFSFCTENNLVEEIPQYDKLSEKP